MLLNLQPFFVPKSYSLFKQIFDAKTGVTKELRGYCVECDDVTTNIILQKDQNAKEYKNNSNYFGEKKEKNV